MLDDDLLAKLKRKDWRDPELERQMVNEEIRTAKDLMLLADDDFKSRPKVHARVHKVASPTFGHEEIELPPRDPRTDMQRKVLPCQRCYRHT